MKGLLVGDSLLRFIDKTKGLDVIAMPGGTIEQAINLFQNKKIPLNNIKEYSFIIIHFGTNNIANGHTKEHIINKLTELNQTIRRYTSVTIYTSTILPRLKDFEHTNPIIKDINITLYKEQTANHKVLQTFRPFITHNATLHEHFFCTHYRDGKEDGVHLTERGDNEFRREIQQTLATQHGRFWHNNIYYGPPTVINKYTGQIKYRH